MRQLYIQQPIRNDIENSPERACERMFQSKIGGYKSIWIWEFQAMDFIRNKRNVQIVDSVFRTFYQVSARDWRRTEPVQVSVISHTDVVCGKPFARTLLGILVDTFLYTFQDWNCILIQTIVKIISGRSFRVKYFSYVLSTDLVYNHREGFHQRPIFQPDKSSFHESVL